MSPTAINQCYKTFGNSGSMEVRARSLGSIHVLPDELINMILLFLADEADLVRLSSCSRVLHVLCCEEAIWAHFCLIKAHPADPPLKFLVRAEQTYEALVHE